MARSALSASHVKDFIRLLSANAQAHSPAEKFRDWCELSYCAFAQLTAFDPAREDALEARYLSIVQRYNEDLRFIRDTCPELVAIAQLEVSQGGNDFLGDVAGQLEVLNPGAGQFFTPFEVSRLLARMTLDTDIDAIIARDGYVTFSEPAAGAGSMILACADTLQQRGHRPDIHMLVHAVDVSALAYYMLFLQLTWRVIPALVQRANTLSLEVFEGAYTPACAGFHAHHGHLSFVPPGHPASASPAPALPDVIEPPAAAIPTQLSLL